MSLNKHTHTKHSHVHLKDNKFECKVCDKKFWNSLDLIEHLNDHVTEENVNTQNAMMTLLDAKYVEHSHQ